MWKRNGKSFSNETLNFFFRKFWTSYILDLAKTVRALRISEKKVWIKTNRGEENIKTNVIWTFTHLIQLIHLIIYVYFSKIYQLKFIYCWELKRRFGSDVVGSSLNTFNQNIFFIVLLWIDRTFFLLGFLAI